MQPRPQPILHAGCVEQRITGLTRGAASLVSIDQDALGVELEDGAGRHVWLEWHGRDHGVGVSPHLVTADLAALCWIADGGGHVILAGLAFDEGLHLLVGNHGSGAVIQLGGDGSDLGTADQSCQGENGYSGEQGLLHGDFPLRFCFGAGVKLSIN